MNEWIDIKERLPEEGRMVLVWDGENRETDWLDGGQFYLHGVTHWYPIPAPPEVKA